MNQYEYTTYTFSVKQTLFSKKVPLDLEKIEEEINLMGKKGWELCTQFSAQKEGWTQQVVLIFKRIILHDN